MTLIQYRDINFRGASATTIHQANAILAAAAADGFHSMTLRQLYYQFVSKALIPNSDREYKRLGRIVTDARYAGLISWTAIEDAGRNSYHSVGAQTAEEVLKGLEGAIRLDVWAEQPDYLEVWVEKQALESTIARPCDALRVPYMACKGYLSASEMWRAGVRFQKAIARGQRPVLLHLGDHDPSGIDMTRDSDERLAEFARMGVTVRRLALNMAQVEEYDPPPNPAKQTDSRFTGYEAQFGDTSWELDALPQRVIGRIITDAVKEHLVQEKWDEVMTREKALREPLSGLHGRWDEVSRLMADEGLPLDRLWHYERWLPHPLSVATAMLEASRVVVAHDAENNGHLLMDLRSGHSSMVDLQVELDDAAEIASAKAAERAEARGRDEVEASEAAEEDFGDDEYGDGPYSDED